MVKVLLLGGHGKVALYITKRLVTNSHNVISIIRNPGHSQEILDFVGKGPGSVTPVVQSLEEITDSELSDLVKGIDWVIWSAGAGGKGGPERTKAVDLHAANKFFLGAISSPSVTKFLTISASVARREPASWWSEADKATFKKAWEEIPGYCEAKTAHDEFISAETRKIPKGRDWQTIVLRPGALSDDAGTGKVDLGKAKMEGKINREDVADVAVALVEKGSRNKVWWLDLIQGEESIDEAVANVSKEEVTVE